MFTYNDMNSGAGFLPIIEKIYQQIQQANQGVPSTSAIPTPTPSSPVPTMDNNPSPIKGLK
jgi:hypothetical protein